MARPLILHDGDLDGLAAASIVGEHLREADFLTPPKGMNAYGPEMTALLSQRKKPSQLYFLDLGLRAELPLSGVPTTILDHHVPSSWPEGAEVHSGYGEDPVPTTSLMAWRLYGTPENAWRAALGNAADLGPDVPELKVAARGQTMRAFDVAKSLLGAAKRSSDPDVAIPDALHLLRNHPSCKAILADEGPEATRLRGFQAEVRAELAEAKKVAPKFATREAVAVITFSSPARVHPLVAQSWAGRLPKHIVLAANSGYRAGRVNFSGRTRSGLSIVELLRRIGAEEGFDSADYGNGHDAAAGGSLPTEDYARFLTRIGL